MYHVICGPQRRRKGSEDWSPHLVQHPQPVLPALPERLMKPMKSPSAGNISGAAGGRAGRTYGNTKNGKPPPVPDKPTIRVEKRESFVRKQAKFMNGGGIQVPKNLPKTSVKPRTPAANNSLLQGSPTYVSTPARSPLKSRIQAGGHQRRISSKSESEMPGSPSLQPRNKPLEYVEVDTPLPLSARSPSPALMALQRGAGSDLDSLGDGRDSPGPAGGGSPSQRTMHYAVIDEAATKAVKEMMEEQNRFRSLERDPKKRRAQQGRPH